MKANTTVTTDLQDQINNILATPNVQSITIGTVTTIAPDEVATIINSGTATNQILDFFIPQGVKGDKGNTGDKRDKGDKGSKGDDGSDGERGPAGSEGAPGDSIATAAAIASASAAAGAAGLAGASAASAASAAASVGALSSAIAGLEGDVAGLQIQIDTLGEGMELMDTDIVALKAKTQYQSASVGTTIFTSTVETGNIIGSGTLYTAGNATVIGDVISSSGFTGGLAPTTVKGGVINIGTSEALINSINIGGASTITNKNGIVIFTNPFNDFFTQF